MTKEQNKDELGELNALLSKENRQRLTAFAHELLAEQQEKSQEVETEEKNDSN